MTFEIHESAYKELSLEEQAIVIRMIANMMIEEPRNAKQVHSDFCLDLKTNLRTKGIDRKMNVTLNFQPEEQNGFAVDKFRISLMDLEHGNILSVSGVLNDQIKRTYSMNIN